MNLRGTITLTKLNSTSWFAQRSFFFLLAFGWMITPLIYLFVWSTAASEGTVGGISQHEFIAYYLTLIVVNQFTFSTANWTVGDSIREGHMNIVLLRPLSPITDSIASELAGKIVFLIFDIPIVLGLGLILQPDFNTTVTGFLAFIPALLIAALLRYVWGYALALLAFWATRADALLAVQDSLLFLLAGQVAPITLLPGFIKDLALILPFRYMIGFPIEILTGQLSNMEILSGLIIQAGWTALAIIIAITVWRTGIRRYEAVGG